MKTIGKSDIEVSEDGLISGLFVWDDVDDEFRNVRIEELAGIAIDLESRLKCGNQ